ncbi:hypothetical protein BT67DRAFT_269687 [Trichocladium antarcticum]|uniref:Myb-like domain-containing protein n=1 Tax=Trichocladium antarcticum TaxID=1450529 RepID=A0AAN6UM24_9PEZI|nr:hypothetical protein BT67DRAFT_269687 [Trichocladium antarcticum]
MDRAATESMSRGPGPLRHPTQDANADPRIEQRPGGCGGWDANSRHGGYGLAAAQQASVGSGPGTSRQDVRGPAGPPPPPPRYSYNPDTATATVGIERGEAAVSDQDPTTDDPAAHLTRGAETAALADYPASVYNHGTWTAADDRTLIQARSGGQNWGDLQREHFPTKTANACRKRYERLVERRGVYDYSARRLETVASEYMTMRKEIWSGLAERVGMKWHVVEALCMSAGLRTVQSNARSYSNRARRDNRTLRKAREAHGAAGSAVSADLPLPVVPHPAGTEFGAAFPGHGSGHSQASTTEAGSRNTTTTMPPPPFIPTRRGPLANALPPATQVSFGGYLNGRSRPATALSGGPNFRDASSREPARGAGRNAGRNAGGGAAA